jgi:hypothetical protein
MLTPIVVVENPPAGLHLREGCLVLPNQSGGYLSRYFISHFSAKKGMYLPSFTSK